MDVSPLSFQMMTSGETMDLILSPEGLQEQVKEHIVQKRIKNGDYDSQTREMIEENLKSIQLYRGWPLKMKKPVKKQKLKDPSGRKATPYKR